MFRTFYAGIVRFIMGIRFRAVGGDILLPTPQIHTQKQAASATWNCSTISGKMLSNNL
jgi:hypothetical protein